MRIVLDVLRADVGYYRLAGLASIEHLIVKGHDVALA